MLSNIFSFFAVLSFSGNTTPKKVKTDDEKKEKKESKDMKKENFTENDSYRQRYLGDAFGLLAGKTLYSDVTVVVGKDKVEVPAHRMILAARSPTLEALLYPKDGKKPASISVRLFFSAF
jgi:hypothetical protein